MCSKTISLSGGGKLQLPPIVTQINLQFIYAVQSPPIEAAEQTAEYVDKTLRLTEDNQAGNSDKQHKCSRDPGLFVPDVSDRKDHDSYTLAFEPMVWD
jgi:hypothetical protein